MEKRAVLAEDTTDVRNPQRVCAASLSPAGPRRLAGDRDLTGRLVPLWQITWLNAPSERLEFLPETGFSGVVLFFFLSGFVISYPYQRALAGGTSQPSWKHFAYRRFIKIVPSYVLSIVVLIAVGYAHFASRLDAFNNIVAHLLFIHSWNFATAGSINGVLWSLAVEVQFYVLFPLIWLCFRRTPFGTAAVMIAVALAYRSYEAHCCLHNTAPFMIDNLPGYLDIFAFGLLAAYAYVALAPRVKGPAWRAVGTVVAVGGLVMFWLLSQNLYDNRLSDMWDTAWQIVNRTWWGVSFFLLALGSLFAMRWWQSILANPVMYFLAAISYNWYLYHQPIARGLLAAHIPGYATTDPHQDPHWQVTFSVVAFVVSLVQAALITYLFEKPLLALDPRRFLRSTSVRQLPTSRDELGLAFARSDDEVLRRRHRRQQRPAALQERLFEKVREEPRDADAQCGKGDDAPGRSGVPAAAIPDRVREHDDQRFVPEIQVVRDDGEVGGNRVRDQQAEGARGERARERGDREQNGDEVAVAVLPDPDARAAALRDHVAKENVEGGQRQPGDRRRHPRPGRKPPVAPAGEHEQICDEHARRKQPEECRQLGRVPEPAVERRAGEVDAVGDRDREHQRGAGPHVPQPDQREERKEQVELDFDGQRPQRPDDGSERVRKEPVQEEEVQQHVLRDALVRRHVLRRDHRVCEQHHHVRWDDLQRTPQVEMLDGRLRPAFDEVTRVRVEQHEAGEKKEDLDAEIAAQEDPRNVDGQPERRERVRHQAALVDVVRHDHQYGDAAQAVKKGNVARFRAGGRFDRRSQGFGP